MAGDTRESLIRTYLKEKKGMSDENITYFLREFSKLSESDKSNIIYEMVGKEVYKTNPVGIETFLDDPYYLGDIYDEIFPLWRTMLKEIYPAPFCKKYDQVVLSCATRCFGKGTEIRMFDGSIKTVETIEVGDLVMGDDGTPRKVLSLSTGEETMYTIYPVGNKSLGVKCNAHHTQPLYSLDGSYEKIEMWELFEKQYCTGPKYHYLKRILGTSEAYHAYEIEKNEIERFYGFELDGNHLFQLANGFIQSNSGKTVMSAAILDYEIYLLTCMINPTKQLGVNNIVFAILSKDNSTAVSQIGAEIYKCLTQSPYFKGIVRDKISFSKVDKDGVQITDDILIRAGSSLSTVIGTNLFAGCIDEANAPSPRIAAENLVETRMKIYQEMRDRRESSYSKAPKRTGMLLFTSSPTDEGDVLGEIIESVKKDGVQGVMIRDNIPRWVARNEEMDETFDFFLGSDTKDPCILDGSIELTPIEQERVIQIPAKEDYYIQFKQDPYLAIQNIAGRRTMPETALFNTVSVFEKVFHKENTIFTTDTPTVSINSGLNLDSYLIDKDYFSHPDRPDCFRYIHLDMAYKCDRFGLASVYSDRVKYTDEEGNELFIRKYFVDFCLGVGSKNRESVDILKVLEFIYSLKEKGYPLKLVSTDNHQGEIARQMIAKRGVKTEYLSMEKSKEQYLNLKNVILTQRLEGFKNPPLMTELRGLRESQKRIQKGKGYTDDMSDALAGALWNCSQDRFFKKNNEAISEIIQQTGQTFQNNRNSINTRTFTGLANQLNKKQGVPGQNILGFRYNGF